MAMWSQNRNYWKDNKDMPEDESESEHAHCNGCYKIKCQHKSNKSCSVMHCPLSCGAVFHSCKASEHKELCSKEIVPCVNSFYGCKQSMRRSERGRHLATCPASVVYCTMEWNRWPVFSRERQERVPFTQKNLHARYGQLDVALAMRDQRILYEAMKAPRRVRRSLRNRLTERFPAVPLTSSHSSYVEGGSMDATGATSDEDYVNDAPWDLSKDPPGLQRSICKELFKTDSGSLHLDALDAQVKERNGSENANKGGVESSLCMNSSRTTSCSSFDQKDMVSTSVKHFQGCDMIGLPVSDGHTCISSAVPILAGDINASNAGEFALVDEPALLPKLSDKASEEFSAGDEFHEKKITESSLCGTEFHSEFSVFVSSLADKKDIDQNEGVSDLEKDVQRASAFGDKISHDSGKVPTCVHNGASENACSDHEKLETISVASDILEGRVSSAGITSKTGYIKQLETENSSGKDFSVENTCEKPKPSVQAPPDTYVADQVVASVENAFSPEQLSKLPVDLATSNVDLTISDSSHLLSNLSTNAVDSETKAAMGATSFQQDVLLNPCLTDKATSLEESSSLSIENSCRAVAVSGEALVNSDRIKDAEKAVGCGSESPHPGLSECQGILTDAAESLEFFPELVFLGIDVASVSSLYHHNAVVFLPPTGGTIANPGTVVVDLPKEYHSMVESSSVPPPAIPPPLTLQEILALDLNLESITRYQAKPRSMYTFLCAQNFRRDEYPWHFKNVHSDIHGGLSGWIEARCPLACYGCTYSTRRLNPVNGTVLYNSEVDCFGVRPNLSHRRSLGELSEGLSRAQKEATPEIYTSKDYDSAVNIKRRSYTKDDKVLESKPSSQVGFTDGVDAVAQDKGTSTDRHTPNEDHDVFPPPDELSTKDIPGASLNSNSMTNSLEGAIVKGLDESLLLRVLPFEVLQHIARCLDSFSLCNLAMTSHFLREVCRSIVEHRGIVVQEWEKKQFDSGSSWQVTYQRWLFSSAFTPCNEWRFEESPSISEHLKVCPFNVMAEPRNQPFQLCCLSMSEDDYRNHEAEKILQKMYPEFDPKSVCCADSTSRMPGAEVLDHLYVNEIGKSGFSGYKRALKSFAEACSEQFRDTPEPKLETDTSEQCGDSLEPQLEVNTSEVFEDYLEPKLETLSSEKFVESLQLKLKTKSSEQLGDYLEPKLETNTLEEFGEPPKSKQEKSAEQLGDSLEPQEIKTSQLFEDYMEPKLETISSEKCGESLEPKLETKALEQFGDYLEPKLETSTLELFEDSLESKLETMTSEKVGGSTEPILETITSEQTKLEVKTSEQFGDFMEQNLEPKT